MAWLGIPRPRLLEWESSLAFPRKKGTGSSYDGNAVVRWLVEQVRSKDAKHVRRVGSTKMPVLEYVNDVAKFFKVTPATVRVWMGSGCPGTMGNAQVPGDFPLSEMNAWVCDRLKARHMKDANAPADRLNELRAEKMGLQVRQAAGELVDKSYVERFLGTYVRRVRTFVTGYSREAAAYLPDDVRDAVVERLDVLSNGFLGELADWDIDGELAEQNGAGDVAT